MLTPPSARAWQSLPSVPGLSSRLIVNSFAVGMLGNLLQLCLGNAGRAFLRNRKIPGFEWKNATDGFLCNLGPVEPSGQGRARRLQCDLHRAFTSFPQGRTGVTSLGVTSLVHFTRSVVS